jgi:hypothetical protein
VLIAQRHCRPSSGIYGGADDQSYGAEEKMRDHGLVPVFRIGIRGMALITIFSIGLPPGPITSQETCEDTFLDCISAGLCEEIEEQTCTFGAECEGEVECMGGPGCEGDNVALICRTEVVE